MLAERADEILGEFIAFMDKYGIPWAPVFGNHDNECKLGVAWQCEQFAKSKYCLFKRGDITGNGNYNIGIFNKGKLVRVVYMIDTNGCGNGKTYCYLPDYPPYNTDEKMMCAAGIFEDQLDFIENTAAKTDELNGSSPKNLCAATFRQIS